MRLNLLRRAVRFMGGEAGFTIIELGMTALILAIVSAPIAGILMAANAQSSAARARTSADQLLASQVEFLRTLPYTQVGVTGGNPDGILDSSDSDKLASGEAVTITTKVAFVNDPIPTAYVTNADYKKVTITITRTSDGKQLGTSTTYVASASAPPLAGTDWVQIKRTVLDAVKNTPVVGASVHLTGGPSSEDRTDTTLRMYKNGASLTINVQNANGTAYTGGATVSLQSSRCGVGSVSVPVGQSSVVITNCQWATGKTVNLVPNVLSQTPTFDKYSATAYQTSSGLWGTATPFVVPSNYPTTMTQSVTIKFSSTTYPSTKTLNVTVTKSGVADANARVLVSGGPAGVALYGTTDSSGKATFTIPVTSTSTSYTIAPNDMGVVRGSASFSASTATTNPINQTVAIS
jgi:hypothetical protein